MRKTVADGIAQGKRRAVVDGLIIPTLKVSAWEPFIATKAWALANGVGVTTVWVQFRDMAGNISDADPVRTGAQSYKDEIVFSPLKGLEAIRNEAMAAFNLEDYLVSRELWLKLLAKSPEENPAKEMLETTEMLLCAGSGLYCR